MVREKKRIKFSKILTCSNISVLILGWITLESPCSVWMVHVNGSYHAKQSAKLNGQWRTVSVYPE